MLKGSHSWMHPPTSHLRATGLACFHSQGNPAPSHLQAMFDGFTAACRSALGMRVGITPVQPRADDAGLLVRQGCGEVPAAVQHRPLGCQVLPAMASSGA